MQSLFEKKKIISIFLWAFFGFSLFMALDVFSELVGSRAIANLTLCFINSLLSFGYFFIYQYRFSQRLNFIQYIIYNIFYSLLFLIFSFLYFEIVIFDKDGYALEFFWGVSGVNLFVGSFLYPLTLIKKSEI